MTGEARAESCARALGAGLTKPAFSEKRVTKPGWDKETTPDAAKGQPHADACGQRRIRSRTRKLPILPDRRRGEATFAGLLPQRARSSSCA